MSCSSITGAELGPRIVTSGFTGLQKQGHIKQWKSLVEQPSLLLVTYSEKVILVQKGTVPFTHFVRLYRMVNECFIYLSCPLFKVAVGLDA